MGNTSNGKKKNQVQQILYFQNLKSNVLIKKVFCYLKQNKLLEIVKHNKNLQNKLNIAINNFKEYSQLHSSIEIELKVSKNKYDKFINMSGDEDNYKIYFDNSTEEITRNYIEENEKVNIIKIIINDEVESFNELFKDCNIIALYHKSIHGQN